MEAFLKGAYQEIVRLICRLWAYRLKILVYIILFVLVAHALNPYQQPISDIRFIPEEKRFIIPLLLTFFLSIAIAECLIKIGNSLYKRFYLWRYLSTEELEFLAPYFQKNTKTKYVVAYNGTWRDSGTINLLLNKNIIYLASTMSEFRSEEGSLMSADQHFPSIFMMMLLDT